MKHTFCLMLATVLTTSAFAAVPPVPKVKPTKPSTVVNGGGSDVASSEVIIASQTEPCKSENSISLELFKKVMVQDGANITIKKNWNYCANGAAKCGVNFTMTIPAHIQNCVSLQAIPKIDGNNIYMEFKNAFEFTADNVAVSASKTFDTLTLAEKYEGCLIKSGILKDGKWDMSKAQIGVTMLSVPKRLEKDIPASEDEFAKALKDGKVIAYDNKVDSKILGLSSLDFAKEYPIPSSDVVGVDNPVISGCYQAQVVDGGALDISKDLKLRSEAKAACDARDYSAGVAVEGAIGNSFADLSKETKDVIAQLRASLREERAKKGKEYLDELVEVAANIVKSKDEDEVRSLSSDYVATLGKYKAEIMDPLIAELEQLYDARAQVKSSDPKRQRELDEQIRKLNDLLGAYSSPVYKTIPVVDKLLEFGVSLDATYVYEMSQKSRLYKEVRHVGSPKRKPAQVSVDLKKLTDTYQKRVDQAEKIYAARTGAASYSAQYQSTANTFLSRRDQAYAAFQKEEQQYAQYCQYQIWGTMKNPARCKYGMQTQQQRYNSMMRNYNYYNAQATQNAQYYNTFNQLEVAARQRAMAENGGVEPGSLYDPYGGDALYNFNFLNNYMGGAQAQNVQGFDFTGQRFP